MAAPAAQEHELGMCFHITSSLQRAGVNANIQPKDKWLVLSLVLGPESDQVR